MPGVGVASLLRRRRTWEVGALLAAVVATRAVVGSGDAAAWEVVVFTVLPVALVAVVVAMEVEHRRWVAVGGLLLAVPPVAVGDLAAGRRSGAFALVAAAGLIVAVRSRRGDPGVRTTLAATVAAVAVGLWTVAGEEHPGPAPGWDDVVGSTGSIVRASVVSGVERFGTGALLLWSVGVGVVVTASVLAGRRRPAAAVPLAFAAFVAVAWMIERWVGPVAASDGTWVLGAGIALAASSEGTRVDGRRLGRSAAVLALASWAWDAVDEASRLDRSGVALALAAAAPALLAGWLWHASRRPDRPAGVNVIGYFGVTSGLGERARMLSAALRAGGVEVSELDVSASASPQRLGDGRPVVSTVSTAPTVVYDTTIAVVTALEFGSLPETHAAALDGTRLIGYWFWELDSVPADHQHAIAMVDEIWTPTTFVAEAYRGATSKPVRLVPLPIPEPTAAATAEREGGHRTPPYVFLTSFDHLSVMERKNPLGAIEAFLRAFPNGDEPVQLVVKTINAEHKAEAADALAAAAAVDDRIDIRDVHLTDRELAALVADADAFVSLHRSEGLGLHLGDAMWLGTPVIASDYGGSTDILDDSCALLVPVRDIAVVDGDGAYPAGAVWADPDLDAAAAAMRSVVADPDSVARLAAAARRVMLRQPDLSVVGRSLRRVLHGWSSDGRPLRSSTRRDDVDSVAPMRRTAQPTPGGPA